MLFFASLLAFMSLLMLLTYRYRNVIILYLPIRAQSFIQIHNHYTPLTSFEAQANAGLSSSAFDVEANNIQHGDSRAGLDELAAQEVMEIMRKKRVNFDQARLIRHNDHLARNGIDPTGMPLDSKAVTHL